MNEYSLLEILKTVDEEFEYFPIDDNDVKVVGCKDFNFLENNYVSYCTYSYYLNFVESTNTNGLYFLDMVPRNCVIVSDNNIFKHHCNLIFTKNPRYVFAKIIEVFDSNYFDENIQMGKNLKIGSNCSLKNCIIGDNVTIGDNVVIGGPGFGYVKNMNGDKIINFKHYGKVIIEDNVTIHSLCAIDRGTLKDTIIAEGCKIDNLCHIAHNVVIDRNTMISARSLIGGGTKIGKNCWLGAGCTIIDRISIADNSFIGSGANIIKTISDPNGTWVGNPARRIK